jgi:hypothetical protein
MTDEPPIRPDEPAVRFLRSVLTRLRSQPWERDHFDAHHTRAAGEEARTRCATALTPESVRGTDPDALLGLLRGVNGQNTTGHGRGVPPDTGLSCLREALAVLVDERLPLKDRLDRLRPPGGKPMVKGLGPSAISSILHLTDPDRYGVLSGTTESVLRRLGVYPQLAPSASLAVRYEAVNGVMIRLAATLGIDLGGLAYLLGRVQPDALSNFAAHQPRTP